MGVSLDVSNCVSYTPTPLYAATRAGAAASRRRRRRRNRACRPHGRLRRTCVTPRACCCLATTRRRRLRSWRRSRAPPRTTWRLWPCALWAHSHTRRYAHSTHLPPHRTHLVRTASYVDDTPMQWFLSTGRSTDRLHRVNVVAAGNVSPATRLSCTAPLPQHAGGSGVRHGRHHHMSRASVCAHRHAAGRRLAPHGGEAVIGLAARARAPAAGPSSRRGDGGGARTDRRGGGQ